LVVLKLHDEFVLSLREFAGLVQEDDCEFSSSFRCRRLERGDVYFVSRTKMNGNKIATRVFIKFSLELGVKCLGWF
jgi:hypothetical protein